MHPRFSTRRVGIGTSGLGLKVYYTYILRSLKDNSYYIGSTRNISNRLDRHNRGLVKYTSNHLPFVLVHKEEFTEISGARRRELQIKRWKSRKAIERLITKQAAIV